MNRKIFSWIFFVLVSHFGSHAWAQQNTRWNNFSNSNAWYDVGTNWSTGVSAGALDNAVFQQLNSSYEVWWDSVTGNRSTNYTQIQNGTAPSFIRKSSAGPFTYTTQTLDIGHQTGGSGNLSLGQSGQLNGVNLTANTLNLDQGTLTSYGSNISSLNTIRIGRYGASLLSVTDSGILTAPSIQIAAGDLRLQSGAQSSINELGVGFDIPSSVSGTAAIARVESGSQLNVANITTIGNHASRQGHLLVSGAGSKFTTNNLYIGVASSGSGTMQVDSGGIVSSQSATIGFPGSTSSVTVSGSGSRWNSGTMNTGNSAPVDFKIQNQGMISFGQTYFGKSAKVLIENGNANWGTFSLNGASIAVLNGGSVQATSTNFTAGTVDVQSSVVNLGSSSIGEVFSFDEISFQTLKIANGGTVNMNNLVVSPNQSGSGYSISEILIGGGFGQSSLIHAPGSTATWGQNKVVNPSYSTLYVGKNGLYDNSNGTTILQRTAQITINDNGTAKLGNLVSNQGASINLVSGSLYVNGDWDVSLSGVLGPQFNLSSQQRLYFGGTTTVASGAHLSINGGLLSTGQLSNNGGSIDFNSGTLQIIGGNFSVAAAGPLGDDVYLSQGKSLKVTNGELQVNSNSALTVDRGQFGAQGIANAGTVTFSSGNFNLSANGSGQAVNNSGRFLVGPSAQVNSTGMFVNNNRLELLGGASRIGMGVTNAGVITGGGDISGPVVNNASGEIRSTFTNTMLLSGFGNVNNGKITLSYGGTIESPHGLINNSVGRINGDGIFRVGQIDLNHSPPRNGGVAAWTATDSGLFQYGQMNLVGQSQIYGDVWLQGNINAKIIQSGGGNLAFFDDVYSYRVGTTTPEIRAGLNSTITYFGEVRGHLNLSGDGEHLIEGNLQSGFSPGYSSATNLTLGSSSITTFDIAGVQAMDLTVADTSSHYSVLDVGTLRIRDGATFDFSLIPAMMPHTVGGLFDPSIGDRFSLMTWTSIFRRLGSGSTDLAFDPQFVNLNFDNAGLGGGKQWDAIWGANGLTLSVVQAIPEPAMPGLLMFSLVGCLSRRRRTI